MGVLTTNIKLMSTYSILSSLDAISEPPLRGKRSSVWGCLGSFLLMAVCLWIYIPACLSYLSGNFYQSMFVSTFNTPQSFFSRDDYKLAIAIRNKQNGSLYSHETILKNLNAYLMYDNGTSFLKEPLTLCDPLYFAKDINGVVLEDCLIVPDYIEYDTVYLNSKFSTLSLVIAPPSETNPFYSPQFTPSQQQLLFANLLDSYYCEFYFTSKVVTPAGNVQFQLHRAYSTQINVASDSLGATFTVMAGLRTTLMDNSIMPWRNNRNYTLVSYTGNFKGTSALNAQTAALNGAQQVFQVTNGLEVAVRYYKKLDWLLGTIGGGLFLFFAIFWPVFNCYNKNAARFELVEQLLLQKTSSDNPTSQHQLIPARIPKYYMIRRLVPFCRVQQYQSLIQQSEHYNDIVHVLKQIKVARRNLKRKQLLPDHHNSKVIILPEIDCINDQESSHYHSNSSKNDSHPQPLPQDSLVQVQISGQNQSERNNGEPLMESEAEQQGVSASGRQKQVEVYVQPKSQEQNKQVHFQLVEVLQPPQAPVQQQLPQQNQPSAQQAVQASQQHAKPLIINVQNPPISDVPQPFQQLELPQANQQQQIPPQLPREPSLISDIASSHPPPTLAVHPSPTLAVHPPTTLAVRDDKFNLTSEQLNCLHTTENPNVLVLLENNTTFQIMRGGQGSSFPDMLQLQEMDKWEGYYSVRLSGWLSRLGGAVASMIRYLDPFAVRINLVELSHSSTCCGLLLTLAIAVLSILTFALTLGNMGSIQYITGEEYLPASSISFSRSTDSDFNAVLCFNNPLFFQGISKLAAFSFFTNHNGVSQTYTPVQMNNSDPTLNLINNMQFLVTPLNLSDCYRMPNGVPVRIDADGSHFGFSFATFCSNTPTYCNATQTATNANFINAVTKNSIQLLLPAARFNPPTNSLVTDLFTTPYINLNFLSMSPNMSLQETVFASQARLYDDTASNLLRRVPPVKDSNINVGYNTRRTYLKASNASQPSYTFRVRLNQASTHYTLSVKKADWIVGVIGGVIVFWYAVVHLLAGLYSRFNFNAYVAKLVYEEDGYEAGLLKKLATILRILKLPRCLVPRCHSIRSDSDRMLAIDRKMDASLNHLSILKYADNCFRLSSALFSSLSAKNLSLLYFKERVFDDQKVVLTAGRVEAEPEERPFQELQLRDQLLAREQDNRVVNEYNGEKKMQAQSQREGFFTKQELQQQERKVQREQEHENIIQQPQSKVSDLLDFFYEPHTFSFKGSRLFSSVTGGLCCLVMITFIVLVVLFQIASYLNNGDLTTSYDVTMDNGLNSTGLTLTTGANFKLALSLVNKTTLQTLDPTPYFPLLGFSLLQQRFTRNNGAVTPTAVSTHLVPCPTGYIESWIGPAIDSSYFSGLGNALCVPDGLTLEIDGFPQSQSYSSFKLSVYNKAGNATGLANLGKLLNSSYVMIYFSSPRQNSVSRTLEYQMESLLYSGLAAATPFESNISLSKSTVTYDDLREWSASPLRVQSYRYEPYNQDWLGYNYYGPATGNLWFNVSFSYTRKVHSYTITAPKFFEVFGTIGGAIAFFYLAIAFCVIPFNHYLLRYQIGRELYLFGKRSITETKERIKVKLRKNMSDRKRAQRMNNLSEIKILEAFLLRPIACLIGNYNFNQALRTATIFHDRVSRDIDLPQLYLSLYTIRDCIKKHARAQQPPPQIELTDVFFKKLVNFDPHIYNIQQLKNYAKQHRLSSYEQLVVDKARNDRVRVQQIFDSKFLQEVFNVVVDQNREVELRQLGDTMGSINSSLSSFNSSAGEPSLDQNQHMQS